MHVTRIITLTTFVIIGIILGGILLIDSYTTCGCGCCEGTAKKAFTLHPQKIIEEDRSISTSDSECALVGCSLGVKFFYFSFMLKDEKNR